MARLTTGDRSVAGRTALVTGAASGMGRATAYLLADEGARVAVTDRDGEGAEWTAAAIRDAGGEAAAWSLDVTDVDEVATVVAEAVKRLGTIGILVNNAGVSIPAPIGVDGF